MGVEDVLLAGTGAVYVAPFGSPLPESGTEPLDETFQYVGLCTTDGVGFLEQHTYKNIRLWPSHRPNKRVCTGRDTRLRWSMLETDELGWTTAFGGGLWETLSEFESRFTPPADGMNSDEYSVIVDALDVDIRFRLVVGRGQIVSDVNTQFSEGAPTFLPVELAVNAETPPWQLYRSTGTAALGDVFVWVQDIIPGEDGFSTHDIFVDELTGEVYEFTGTSRTPGSPRDPLHGHGAPDPPLGQVGDAYIDFETADTYSKEG